MQLLKDRFRVHPRQDHALTAVGNGIMVLRNALGTRRDSAGRLEATPIYDGRATDTVALVLPVRVRARARC